MLTVSSASLAVLVAVFFLAAVAKLRSPGGIAPATLELGAPRWIAPFLVPAECCVVVALVLAPRIGSALAIVMLSAFTFLLVRVVRSGRAVSCACFGAASAALVTATTVARNVGLLVLAVVAGFSPSLIDLPANAVLPMLLLDAGIIVVGLLAGALLDIRRITGAMFPTIRAEA